jgi:phosphatidate cytidylyltransferase
VSQDGCFTVLLTACIQGGGFVCWCCVIEDVNCLQGASKQHRETGEPNITPGQIRGQRQSVGQRWVTALIMIPIVLVFVWFGGWMSFAAITVVVVLATIELHRMLLHAGYRPLFWISLGLGLLFLVAAMFPQQQSLLLEIGLTGALILSFVWFFFRKNLNGALLDWSLTLIIAVYLGWPMSFLLLLRGYEPGVLHLSGNIDIDLPRGAWWLMVTLLGVWGFDSAAFFTGRYLGRHKLAPHISPGKTWEGVAGGLVLSIIAVLLFTVSPLGVPWYLAVGLGVLIGIAAVTGDLAESLIKRQTHVKDSGQIMPGHGGMLDRIDSLLFAVMVVYLFVRLVGV